MKFQGGESAVQRLMQAYGFTMKKQLGDHLGAGTGTISTWVKRDYFPGEAIVRCALETGASLSWLATGIGSEPLGPDKSTVKQDEMLLEFPVKKLFNGNLFNEKPFKLTSYVLEYMPKDPILILSNSKSWIIEKKFENIIDGIWLVKIQNVFNVAPIKMLPRQNILINNVEWPLEDVEFHGYATASLEQLIRDCK